MKTIPLFYFPTTLMAVDDQDTMLDLLKHEIGSDFRLITEKSPDKAIELISKYTNNSIITNFITNSDEDDIQHENTSMVQFDFSKILKIANNPNRYDTLSVLICDHMMPDMTGIELCKRLENKMFKKILLTGKADENNVIEAFNWGIINRYVKKSDADSINELRIHIKEMVIEYFIELSENLKPILPKLTILSDPEFVSFFNKLINENGINEYYLIDKNGSYLLIDKDGKKSALVISTDDDLDGFIEFFGAEQNIQNYLNQVKLRKSIPFFGIDSTPVKVPVKNWSQYFFNSTELKCEDKTIYWSLCSC